MKYFHLSQYDFENPRALEAPLHNEITGTARKGDDNAMKPGVIWGTGIRLTLHCGLWFTLGNAGCLWTLKTPE